jgi:DNA-binding NarL/FixJ family response regulator
MVADDHALMREGVRHLLENSPNVEFCGEARDGREAIDEALRCKPDVAVIDLIMPVLGGLEATRLIRKKLPNTKVLIFSAHDADSMVRDVLTAERAAYILKADAATDLIAAVEAIANENLYFSAGVSGTVLEPLLHHSSPPGEKLPADCPLTHREIEVVRLLAKGSSNKEIASDLRISVRTVETHRRSIFHKLETTSLAGVVRFAIRYNLIAA